MNTNQKNIIIKSIIACIFAIIGMILIYQSSKGFIYTRITKTHKTTDALVIAVSNINTNTTDNINYAYSLEYTINKTTYSTIDVLNKKICDYGQFVTIYYSKSNPDNGRILRVEGYQLYFGLFFLVMTIVFLCNFRKINILSEGSIFNNNEEK